MTAQPRLVAFADAVAELGPARVPQADDRALLRGRQVDGLDAVGGQDGARIDQRARTRFIQRHPLALEIIG